MRLPPGSSVTGASAAADINRTKPVASNTGVAAPSDGIRLSNAFETLALASAHHTVRVARIAAAVHSGTYRVNSAAVGKSIIEDALSG